MQTLTDIRRDNLRKKLEYLPHITLTAGALVCVWLMYSRLFLMPLAYVLAAIKPPFH